MIFRHLDLGSSFKFSKHLQVNDDVPEGFLFPYFGSEEYGNVTKHDSTPTFRFCDANV